MKFSCILSIPILVCICFSHTIMAAEATNAGPSKIKEGYAELGSGRIYYRDSGGSGAAVVFLHAASGNTLLFEKQEVALITAGYRFISYDRAGQGRSPRGGGSGNGGSNDPELEQLMDYLKIDRFHLVGIAAGGGVALQYTLNRPDRVLSIVVANSIGNVQDQSYTAMSSRIRPAAFNQLPLEMRELGPSYRAVNPEGVQRWLDLSQQRGAVTLPESSNTPSAESAPAPVAQRSNAPPRSNAGNPNAPVTFAGLEKMTVPTLLLTGDADLYTPPSVLRMFKEHMPAADIYIITESGHSSQWENPEEFNRRILEFLHKH